MGEQPDPCSLTSFLFLDGMSLTVLGSEPPRKLRLGTSPVMTDSRVKQKSPFVVELIGLAGAGKTTVWRALGEQNKNIGLGPDLELRKVQHIPIFISHAAFLLPVLLRGFRTGRWFAWDEIKAMVYLRAWPRVLGQQSSHGYTTVLLDHGPVFKLATLNAFGPERLRSRGLDTWWRGMYERWAFTLDMVIWLDAPEAVLVERINSRSQRHAVKGWSDREAYDFLARYRRSYEQIMAELNARDGPTLLHFDTSRLSIEEIAAEVLINCDLESRAR